MSNERDAFKQVIAGGPEGLERFVAALGRDAPENRNLALEKIFGVDFFDPLGVFDEAYVTFDPLDVLEEEDNFLVLAAEQGPHSIALLLQLLRMLSPLHQKRVLGLFLSHTRKDCFGPPLIEVISKNADSFSFVLDAIGTLSNRDDILENLLSKLVEEMQHILILAIEHENEKIMAWIFTHISGVSDSSDRLKAFLESPQQYYLLPPFVKLMATNWFAFGSVLSVIREMRNRDEVLEALLSQKVEDENFLEMAMQQAHGELAVGQVLELVKYLPTAPEDRRRHVLERFFERTDLIGAFDKNMLSLALENKSGIARVVLETVPMLSPETQLRLFSGLDLSKPQLLEPFLSYTNHEGDNLLEMAIKQDHDSLKSLLDAIQKLPESKRNQAFKRLFAKKNVEGVRVDMLVLATQQEDAASSVGLVLDVICRLPQGNAMDLLDNFLENQAHYLHPAFIKAMVQTPETFHFLLFLISNRWNASDAINALLEQTNDSDDNFLGVAIRQGPRSVSSFLEFIGGLPDAPARLNAFLRHKNQYYLEPVFIQAVLEKPQIAGVVLGAICESEDDQLLAGFLSDKYYLTPEFITVMAKNGQVFCHVLDVIVKQPNHAVMLDALLKQTDAAGKHFLEMAIHQGLGSVQKLSSVIQSLPEATQSEIWARFLANAEAVFCMGIQKGDDYGMEVLTLIQTLPPKRQREVFNRLFSPKNAARHQTAFTMAIDKRCDQSVGSLLLALYRLPNGLNLLKDVIHAKGWTPLNDSFMPMMLAHATVFCFVLDAIREQKDSTMILKSCVMLTGMQGWNLLHIAKHQGPRSLRSLLLAIQSMRLYDQKQVLDELLSSELHVLSVDPIEKTPFVIAMQNEPGEMHLLFDVMSRMPGTLKVLKPYDPNVLEAFLSQVNTKGDNLLEIVVKERGLDSKQDFLEAIEALPVEPEDTRGRVLEKLFPEESHDPFGLSGKKDNVLMRAVQQGAAHVDLVLQVLDMLPDARKKGVLETLTTQINSEGQTVLGMAERRSPEIARTLESFMKSQVCLEHKVELAAIKDDSDVSTVHGTSSGSDFESDGGFEGKSPKS